MKKSIFTLCAVTAVMAVTACESSPKTLPPGHYTHTEKSTSTSGKDTQRTTNTNVYVDQNGNKKAVQSTETSTDPDGWFNKSTTKSTKTYN